MTFIIHPLKQFCRQVKSRQIFVEGFIYRKEEGDAPNDPAKRVRFESELILTCVADGIVRACKIKVESGAAVAGERLSIDTEYFRVRRNIGAAVDICIEKLGELGASGAETGTLKTPGLTEDLAAQPASSGAGWWHFDAAGELERVETNLHEKYPGLLMEILSNCSAAKA